jgi:hypothetical protein
MILAVGSSWGYFTSNLKGKILCGFVATPPGIEMCGEYDIVFVAALKDDNRIIITHGLHDDNRTSDANVHISRTTNEGNLVIKAMPRSYSETTFSVKVDIQGYDQDFGPGYNFLGFSSFSELKWSYVWKPSNASIIWTKWNKNTALRCIRTQGILID